MRECSKCWIQKECNMFFKDKNSKDWLRVNCKECVNKYSKTKVWLIGIMYASQRWSSKKRGHNNPNYTRIELQEWIFNNSAFEMLYNNWKNNWYSKMLKPSCDRINNEKPYTFNNLQLITWKENKIKWYKDRKKWPSNKQNRAVICVCIPTWKKTIYYSMSEASIQTWVNQSNISRCCNWIFKRAWNYYWKYKKTFY